MSKLEISPEIVDALRALSALLGHENELERTMQTVVDLSVATLPGCNAAGVTMRVEKRNKTVAATDEFARTIDNIQYEVGEGPCLSALEDNEMVSMDAISEETRWPRFRSRAENSELSSSVSHPLRENGSVGALNLYAKQERAFDHDSTMVAEIFAEQATIALRNAATHRAARLLSEQLHEAINTRDLIGQAKGILMEREGISDAEAFEMLKTISQKANVKLRDIATKLVEDKRRKAHH